MNAGPPASGAPAHRTAPSAALASGALARAATAACLDVYRIDTRAAARLGDAFFACLPATERARAQRLRHAGDRLRRALAYAALLWLAQQRLGVPAHRICIERDARGKPSLRLRDGLEAPHVSLSHSGFCVLLALAACPVGVDVEHLRPIDIEPLRHDYFPRDPFDPQTPQASFFTVWTLKEAALKAVGTGLHIDPAGLTVKPPPRGTDTAFQPLRDCPPGHGLEAIRISALPMPAGYAGAVAARHPRPRVRMHELDGSALLRLQNAKMPH